MVTQSRSKCKTLCFIFRVDDAMSRGEWRLFCDSSCAARGQGGCQGRIGLWLRPLQSWFCILCGKALLLWLHYHGVASQGGTCNNKPLLLQKLFLIFAFFCHSVASSFPMQCIHDGEQRAGKQCKAERWTARQVCSQTTDVPCSWP